MAYELISGPTWQQLPSFILDFAVTKLGWSAPDEDRIVIPGSAAGLSVSIDAYQTTGSYSRRLRARMLDGATIVSTAYCPSPYISEAVVEPSKLHLFGSGGTEEPWLAAVVEYGTGFFRHMYIGRLNRLGNYDGGEVVCGSTHRVWSGTSYRDNGQHYSFSGMQSQWNAESSGAVRLVHADLGGTLIAPFRVATTDDSINNLIANAVFGGFGDNINDQQIARGQNSYAGVQIFNPVNIYLSRAASRVTPIGNPPGVRQVNMTDIGPGTTISVGNRTWHCFPQFKKNGASVTGGSSTNQLNDETSYIVGLAYLED